MDLAALTARANVFGGLDLSGSEVTDLANEARRRFALRSRYPRKYAAIAETVDGQSVYDWPDDYLVTIGLSLAGGSPWEAADPSVIREYETGGLILLKEGAWYEQPDANGDRKLHLYPVPGPGLDIELEWVFRPPPLSESTDIPTEIPEEFHPGLCWEIAAVYYDTVEDDPQESQRFQEKADGYVNQLIAYDNERRGSGVFLPQIVGWTA